MQHTTCHCFRFCRNLSCLRALSVGCVPLFPASPVAASQLNTRLISAAYNLPLLSFLPQLPWSSKRCHLRRSVCDQLRALLARARERERDIKPRLPERTAHAAAVRQGEPGCANAAVVWGSRNVVLPRRIAWFSREKLRVLPSSRHKQRQKSGIISRGCFGGGGDQLSRGENL